MVAVVVVVLDLGVFALCTTINILSCIFLQIYLIGVPWCSLMRSQAIAVVVLVDGSDGMMVCLKEGVGDNRRSPSTYSARLGTRSTPWPVRISPNQLFFTSYFLLASLSFLFNIVRRQRQHSRSVQELLDEHKSRGPHTRAFTCVSILYIMLLHARGCNHQGCS